MQRGLQLFNLGDGDVSVGFQQEADHIFVPGCDREEDGRGAVRIVLRVHVDWVLWSGAGDSGKRAAEAVEQC